MRERLNSELKAAMKAGDQRRVGTLRMVNAALKDKDIEARGRGKTFADEEIPSLLQKLIKSRQESAEIYAKAGRAELATQEREEIAIIQSFLPQPLTAAEADAAIAAALAETGAASIKDMGRVIGALKTKYAGRMDIGKASAAVKAKLGG
ncbi:MAG: GatB/YqeY domain-containing protein [Methylovirgula sp.]